MIGILGGTFDPVHLGHIHIAQCLLESLPLDEIRFLPCYQPVHRDTPGATAKQRLAMLQLALAENEKFIIDERELTRQGPSFMIDTLQSLRDEFKTQPLAFILGADVFDNITTWKDWEKLIDYAHMIIVDRNHVEPTTPDIWASRIVDSAEALSAQRAGQIYFAHTPLSKGSATDIRQHLSTSDQQPAFLTDTVWRYIQEHNIYR